MLMEQIEYRNASGICLPEAFLYSLLTASPLLSRKPIEGCTRVEGAYVGLRIYFTVMKMDPIARTPQINAILGKAISISAL